MGNHFFKKAQNFMHFLPHDFREILPAGHVYAQEGITYVILVLQHQQYFITSSSMTWPPEKITPKMHSVLNDRKLRQKCKYMTFSFHKRVSILFRNSHVHFRVILMGISWRNCHVYDARCNKNDENMNMAKLH